MNHLHRVMIERDQLQAQIARLDQALIDLQHYLGSSKFHQEDWVSAREMWRRIQEIRCYRWEVTA